MGTGRVLFHMTTYFQQVVIWNGIMITAGRRTAAPLRRGGKSRQHEQGLGGNPRRVTAGALKVKILKDGR